MILKDIIDELRLGELSGANLGDNDKEGVTPYNYEKLVSYINSALTAIHSRIPLRVREVLLEEQSTITVYQLDRNFAKSNATSTAPVKYLNDLADPFDDAVLRVESVYNAEGTELPLDDMTANNSIFRPTLTSLQVPFPVTGNVLSVIYRANHSKLIYSNDLAVLLNQRIELPPSYSGCIVAYVMYKYKSSFDSAESQNSATAYMALFEQLVSSLKDFGLVPENNLTITKLEQNGWV